MSSTPSQTGPLADRKRKDSRTTAKPSKRARLVPDPSTTSNQSLVGPHEAIIAELRPRNNVLTASVISSTKIQKRITQTIAHLSSTSELPNVVLLHARTAEVCKLISIVEQCKRVLGKEGKTWYQYNDMFELPQRGENDLIEETVLEKDGDENEDDSDDDDFEVMASRFESAVLPEPSRRVVKSLRVFLSLKAVDDLKKREGVTVQSSEAA